MADSPSPASGGSAADLSIVILSWNTKELVRECLTALRGASDGLRTEIVVIDNASEDGSPDLIAAEFPEVVLVRNAENRGYAPGVNQGIARSTGRRVCLLGSDTRVRPGTFEALCAFLDAHPTAGAVAPPLLNPDGSRQCGCKRFPTLGLVAFWDLPPHRWFPDAGVLRRYEMKDWDHMGTREVDQPPGTCFLVRREVIDRVGPMDEKLWLFFNDVDWALRIRQAGFSIWHVEAPGVFHRESSSVGKFRMMALEWHKNRIWYFRKHHGFLGRLFTGAALLHVTVRECLRARKNLPTVSAWWNHSRGLLRMAVGLIRG